MWDERILPFLPHEALELALTLALSFLIGLEREQHKVKGDHFSLGGIRTFPFLGVTGYAFALLSGDQVLPIAIGFAVIGLLMGLSYWHKLTVEEHTGMTTELSALATYLLGALVARHHLWLATAMAVIGVLLLELKAALESIPARIPPEELSVFARFLLLTAVLLPVVPNRDFTRFHINPFKTWLVVAAVSTVSYGSYVLTKWLRGRGGVFLSGILGGVYSSTVTTVALAKQAAGDGRVPAYAGAIAAASGVMFLRLGVLLVMFNRAMLSKLWLPFLVLAVIAVGAGALVALPGRHGVQAGEAKRNPLELRSALLFAALFVGMMTVSRAATGHLGHGGTLLLAAIFGVVDVDPFILGLAQTAGGDLPLASALESVLVAAASNNVAKAGYAMLFGGRKLWPAAALLAGLAALGLIPLLWL
jgi:uncharacterized membrane protein (DUF4010 family)